MAARRFSRTVRAGSVLLAERTYEITIHVSAPVGSPADLRGTVEFTDTDPRNKPTDKRNYFDEEVYADRLSYSFGSIDRLVKAYEGCKKSLAETCAERAAERGLDQSAFWIEAAAGVLTLFIDAGNWHWSKRGSGAAYDWSPMFGPNWLTTSMEETDAIVTRLRETIVSLRSLTPPECLEDDLADVEKERRDEEEKRLRDREERLERIRSMEDEGARRPSRVPTSIDEDE